MHANDPNQDDVCVSIVRQIIWMSRKHFQLNSALLEETGLGSGQVPVLMELSHGGQLSQKELSKRVHVTPATMSGLLKRMEGSGFIRRTANESDARVSLVELTDAGRAQCEVAHDAFSQNCHRMLDGLDLESQLQLKRLLDRIQDNLGGADCCRSESSKKE